MPDDFDLTPFLRVILAPSGPRGREPPGGRENLGPVRSNIGQLGQDFGSQFGPKAPRAPVTEVGTLNQVPRLLDPNSIDDVQELVRARAYDTSAFQDLIKRGTFAPRPPVPTNPVTNPVTPVSSSVPEFDALLRGARGFGGARTIAGNAARAARAALPAVRAVGQVANILGPFLDQIGYWDEYMYGANRRAEAQRVKDVLSRGRGPTKRGGKRRPTRNIPSRYDVGMPAPLPDARIQVPAPSPLPSSDYDSVFSGSNYNGGIPEPDPFGRDMSRPVATPRGVGTGVQPTTAPTTAPESLPWWETVGQGARDLLDQIETARGYAERITPFVQDLRDRIFHPRGNTEPQTATGSQPTSPTGSSPATQPGSATSTQPQSSTEQSSPRCSSSDPCMMKAAAKRREQRARKKECSNVETITREVRVCRPSPSKSA